MLKELFSSNTRVKLLTTFLTSPGEEFFIRELTRKLSEQINSIRRELNNLKKIGLLKSRSKFRKKYFSVNDQFPILEDLRSIIVKCTDPRKELVKKMERLGEIFLVIFSGVLVSKPEKPLDLLVIGNIDREDLASFLETEVKNGKTIRFGILTKDDFLYRLRLNDKFIIDMLSDPDNIRELNKLKNQIQKHFHAPSS